MRWAHLMVDRDGGIQVLSLDKVFVYNAAM